VDALRLATTGEARAIDDLMKVSTRDLFPHFYDERQTASAIVHIASVDEALLRDGTYYVIEEGAGLVACGGWSRRDKLFTGAGDGAADDRMLDPSTEAARVRAMFVHPDRTRRGLGTRILEACEQAARAEGFRSLALMATLPGLPLYESYGFVVAEEIVVTMPDGVTLPCAAMEMPLQPVP
jgi:GNAT superfamily N-acetyltransferase